MSKPTLLINENDLKNSMATLGMTETLTYLRDSGEFDVGYHTDKVRASRNFRAAILKYNDKKIYLDFWEYSTPTHTKAVVEYDFDLIIKLQHGDMTEEFYEKKCQRKKILINLTCEERMEFLKKIIPWTFFPSKLMKNYVGSEESLHNSEVNEFGFFCGKRWKGRGPIKIKLEKENIEFIMSDCAFRTGRPLNDKTYLERMMGSKFGIVLRGRSSHVTEAKNRREIDYMMLRKPILINYKPFYYNPLIEGKHYIFFNEETDLGTLENLYNIDEIAENGYQWYKDNASPNGIVKTFKQIMKDKFGE